MGRRGSHVDEPRYPPGFPEALGRTIKVIRTDLGLERRELAERAGISYSYITEIENGNKPPSSSVLDPIARALGMRMSELIQAAEDRQETADKQQMRSEAYECQASPASPARLLEEPPSRSERFALQFGSASTRSYAMRPSFRDPNRNLRAVLRELEELLPLLSKEDVDRVLDLARRLAR